MSLLENAWPWVRRTRKCIVSRDTRVGMPIDQFLVRFCGMNGSCWQSYQLHYKHFALEYLVYRPYISFAVTTYAFHSLFSVAVQVFVKLVFLLHMRKQQFWAMLSIQTVQVFVSTCNTERDAHSLPILSRSYFARCSCVRGAEGHIQTYSDRPILTYNGASVSFFIIFLFSPNKQPSSAQTRRWCIPFSSV
jgi:hypothetical protein